MGFARFPNKPQLKVQVKHSRDQVIMRFGNGYEEILNKDPHGELREYSFTYTHLTSNLLPLISFLEEHSDGTPFIFTDPIDNKDVTVIINGGYSVVNDSPKQTTISCALRESRSHAT